MLRVLIIGVSKRWSLAAVFELNVGLDPLGMPAQLAIPVPPTLTPGTAVYAVVIPPVTTTAAPSDPPVITAARLDWSTNTPRLMIDGQEPS